VAKEISDLLTPSEATNVKPSGSDKKKDELNTPNFQEKLKSTPKDNTKAEEVAKEISDLLTPSEATNVKPLRSEKDSLTIAELQKKLQKVKEDARVSEVNWKERSYPEPTKKQGSSRHK